jgi:hypothetical protein
MTAGRCHETATNLLGSEANACRKLMLCRFIRLVPFNADFLKVNR